MLVSENGVISSEGIRLENPFESGYTTGYGLFETVCVNRGVLMFLREHYERMAESLSLMKLPALPEYDLLSAWCDAYVNELSGKSGKPRFSGKIRINWVKKGCNGADLHIYGELFSYPMEWYKSGIRSCFSKDVYFSGNRLDRIKALSYAGNMIEKSRAMENGFPETVRVNGSGLICEGSISNVFWVEGSVLHTPSVETGALPGIIRRWVIDKAKELGILTVEESVGKPGMERADAIFFTNSLMGIMPVSEFENRSLNTMENKIYEKLREAYFDLLER